METEARIEIPLSAEEESAWDLLVAEGRRLRAPKLAEKEARRAENRERSRRLRGDAFHPRGAHGYSDSLDVIPSGVKRWVVARYAGCSFKKASEGCGVSWLDIQNARYRSEEVRCAMAAQESFSRQLMLAKAQSIVEQSQEEGTHVSMAQTQVSMKILASLDRANFGEARDVPREDDGTKAVGGGGFVINVIGDAAAVCAKPVEKTGRALVYTDV